MTERKIRLFDPHPGSGGAILPLPEEMKSVVDSLDGKIMPYEEAERQIRTIAKKLNGAIEDKGSYISFEFTRDKLQHGYRLIRYEKVES